MLKFCEYSVYARRVYSNVKGSQCLSRQEKNLLPHEVQAPWYISSCTLENNYVKKQFVAGFDDNTNAKL